MKHVFLITDTTGFLSMQIAYGDNVEEAKKYYRLNSEWSYVEDVQTIKTFIAEKRMDVIPENLPERLQQDWLEYDEHLNILELTITETKRSETMEYSIKLQSGETLYHPLHDELNTVWETIVIAHESFDGTEEFQNMVTAYIAMRMQTEGNCLWEDRTSSWYEDCELAQQMEESA